MACVVVEIHLSAFHVTCRACGHHAVLASGSGELIAWAHAHRQPWLQGIYSSVNTQRAEYQPMRTPRLLR
jgi:hypothetical protein